MSLLIKALQKAEDGKKADSQSTDAPSLSLEELPKKEAEVASSAISEPKSDVIPEATKDPEPVSMTNAPSVSSPVQTARPVLGQHSKPPADENRQLRQQAAVMFSAKSKDKNPNSTKKAILISLVIFLILGIGGWEFYSYLQSLSQPAIVMARPQAPVMMPEKPVNAEPSAAEAVPAVAEIPDNKVAEIPQNPQLEAAKQAVVSGVDTAMQKLDQALEQAKQTVNPELAKPTKKPTQSEQIAFGEPVPVTENTTVKITRNTPQPKVNPDIATAYQAFNSGNDAIAQQYYRQALRSDVRNVDALLGMAAVAARQGRNDDALGWYGKVLEVEPRNTVAQAAMVSVVSQTDPVGSESRIKNLLVQQPEAAYLHAALGSIYAEQNQWAAAQQSYFQAYHFDTGNPEYAFNLAVSLDQLGKPTVALPYYKQALELARRTGSSGIDLAQLESRIAQIK